MRLPFGPEYPSEGSQSGRCTHPQGYSRIRTSSTLHSDSQSPRPCLPPFERCGPHTCAR